MLIGTLILAAVYGFLDLEYRSSRILIILGMIWAFLSTTALRVLIHFIRFGNFGFDNEKAKHSIIVGSQKESDRVLGLIHQAQVRTNFIGMVAPKGFDEPEIYLSSLEQLDEVVQIYKVDEIIFCSKDIAAREIMLWMTKLGSKLEYKIVPEESISIIGSSSKNSAGELYTIDIQFGIAQIQNQRNKRVTDLLLAFFFLLTYPISFWFVKNKMNFLYNIFRVIRGKKTWVGYSQNKKETEHLPKIRAGILNPIDGIHLTEVNQPTIQRLDFLYAKDYSTVDELEIIWRGFKELGR